MLAVDSKIYKIIFQFIKIHEIKKAEINGFLIRSLVICSIDLNIFFIIEDIGIFIQSYLGQRIVIGY